MATPALHLLLRGPFGFLRQEEEEIRRLFPTPERILPQPQQIFLDDESATPLWGFPLLASSGMRELGQALEDYLLAEEELQKSLISRQSYDRKLYGAAADRFRAQIGRAIENVVSSSSRQHTAMLWLYQSLDVARLLKETPRRLMRQDAAFGREYGEEVRYRTLDRYLDRAVTSTYDAVNELAQHTEEVEDELFPPLLTRMRDNVLIFTETHISPDLAELQGYFRGCLRLDGRDFQQRLAALGDWHTRRLQSDGELRDAVVHLMRGDPANPRELLKVPGYVTYLSLRPGYDAMRLLGRAHVELYENLLGKLKEFELLHALRKMIVPLERDGDVLVARDRSANRRGLRALQLSPATRPFDFTTPWVVDPRVERCGMIYDIASYSEIISRIRFAASEVQDASFRMIFRFQRRVNRFATTYRLKLEKFLGDGAFYSARDARRMLVAAIRTQRYYEKVLEEGFPFDRGMRIALNYGQYRLLPLQSAPDEDRYEFFGHGVVELTRLITGKSVREIDEIKILLIGLGYPEATVNRFFAPISGQNLDVIDKREESRRFYTYLNPNGTLINEGIVATGPYVSRLSRELGGVPLHRGRDGERTYLVMTVTDPAGDVSIGMRKLGVPTLKGLDKVPVYEVVDAESVKRESRLDAQGEDLVSVLEREFLNSMADRRSGSA